MSLVSSAAVRRLQLPERVIESTIRRPPLNNDILTMIISFADEWPGTVAAMMLSCRLFYHEGPKILLKRSGHFWPDWAEIIPKFLRFMRAEGGIRCRYLGALTFDLVDEDLTKDPEDEGDEGPEDEGDEDPEDEDGEDSEDEDDEDSEDEDDDDAPSGLIIPDVAHDLVEFLRNHSFPRVEMVLIDPAEELLLLLPELVPIFTALPSVKHLYLHGCGRIACTIPRSMDKLVDIILDYDHDEQRTPRPMVDIHPLLVLPANSRNTLQSVQFDASGISLPAALSPQPFPGVERLQMNGPHPPIFAPFEHAFPNLQYLYLLDKKGRFGSVIAEGPIIRAGSHRDMPLVRSWKLKQVLGPLRDLYLGGLACEIKHLQTFMSDESTYEALRELVSDAQPSDHFIVQTCLDGMLDDATGLPAMLRSAGGRLREFNGIFPLHPDDGDVDMEVGIAALRAALASHPLEVVKLFFSCHNIPLPDRDLNRRRALPSCPLDEYMATVDLGLLAQSFIDSIPTLELAQFYVTGHRRRKSNDVRASKEGGSVVIERDILRSLANTSPEPEP